MLEPRSACVGTFERSGGCILSHRWFMGPTVTSGGKWECTNVWPIVLSDLLRVLVHLADQAIANSRLQYICRRFAAQSERGSCRTSGAASLSKLDIDTPRRRIGF